MRTVAVVRRKVYRARKGSLTGDFSYMTDENNQNTKQSTIKGYYGQTYDEYMKSKNKPDYSWFFIFLFLLVVFTFGDNQYYEKWVILGDLPMVAYSAKGMFLLPAIVFFHDFKTFLYVLFAIYTIVLLFRKRGKN